MNLFVENCWVFTACHKENFDEQTSVKEEFTPSTSVLSYGVWEISLDTIVIQMDSSWCSKNEYNGDIYRYQQFGGDCKVDFLTDTDDLLFEIGVYDLQRIRYIRKPNMGSSSTKG